MISLRFMKFGLEKFTLGAFRVSRVSSSSGSMRDSIASSIGFLVAVAFSSLGRLSSSMKNSPMVSANTELSVGFSDGRDGDFVGLGELLTGTFVANVVTSTFSCFLSTLVVISG